jgi:ubiquinone/menaquinone biosynthesis C-methylase UbiE
MGAQNVSEPAGYSDSAVARLEMLWGHGFMSPGGPAEVAHLLRDRSISGREVLDVGSGAGGIGLLLVRDHGAASVTAIDVQAELVALSRARAEEAGLADRVDYRLVEPGPFPFADHSFDVVFSKDAIVHVRDKSAIYTEMFRVLRPGGDLLVSDWLRAPGEHLDAAAAAFENFALVTLEEIASLAAAAGFVDLETEDRNAWYLPLVEEELRRLQTDLGATVRDRFGEEELERTLKFWEMLVSAVQLGALSPGHLRARKPS